MLESTYYGGALYKELTSPQPTYTIYPGLHHPRVLVIATSGPGATRTVQLPDATKQKLGGPHYVVVYTTGVKTVDFKDDGGTIVHSVSSSDVVTISLSDNGDADGQWEFARNTLLANEVA